MLVALSRVRPSAKASTLSQDELWPGIVRGARVAREDAGIAKDLLERAMGVHGVPDAVHADRGTSMTSKPVAQLLVDLGVLVPRDGRLLTDAFAPGSEPIVEWRALTVALRVPR